MEEKGEKEHSPAKSNSPIHRHGEPILLSVIYYCTYKQNYLVLYTDNQMKKSN